MTTVKSLAIFLFLMLILPLNHALSATDNSEFDGRWLWAIYANDKSELPPAYQNKPLKDVPEYSLEINIKQKKNKISGHYLSTYRYLSKYEEGDFAATIKGNTALLKLESGFGGWATVRLKIEQGLLHWTVVKDEEENYFHGNVRLDRVR